MISIPTLYELVPKDLAGLSLELWTTDIERAQAGITNFAAQKFFQVPKDRLLILDHCAIQSIAGAGQRLRLARLLEVDEGNVIQGAIWAHTGAAGIDSNVVDRVQYTVRPGGFLNFDAIYDAAVALNQFEFTVQGWLIPRANVTLQSLRNT